MSRCFPYPPPGYEPRPRSQHKDLLKKERHKGKKNRKEKGERKGKERRKGERKGKDSYHKKLKREKRRGRRNNRDRDNDIHRSPEQESQKTGDFDNRRHEERKHEAVKDVKCLDELLAQFPVLGGTPNHKVNNTSELISGPRSSKEKERSFSRSVKKSGDATQQHRGTIQKNGSNGYGNKKGTDGGVSSETRTKNGNNLQVGSGEKHSSRRNSSKGKQMKRNGDVNEQNKIDHLMHLASLDEKNVACDNIKKRKELDANSTFLHENGTETTKLSRMSSTNTRHRHKPQDGYMNGITGSCCLDQKKVSVSSSVIEGNKGYLKPPHQNAKYLSQLPSIPPAPSENTSECIDQEWLFSADRVEQNTATFEAAGSHQVWSDAQLMHTSDVVALPYVVPL